MGGCIKNKADYPEFTEISLSDAKRVTHETYEKFNEALCRYISARLDSTEDVEDLTQEVYLRVFRNIKPELKPSPSFLRAIASNLLKDRLRRRGVRQMDAHFSTDDYERFPAATASPEQILQSKQLYMLFKSVIESVRPASRQAFALHRFKGLTYEEIARQMGISNTMVKKHIRHVMLQFRKKMVQAYER